MKDKGSLHLKVQEFCDCFATTDPLKEMSTLKNESDKDEAALKWLAITFLHGINANAKKITLGRSSSAAVKVTAEYRPALLPSPGPVIGEEIFQAIKKITHFEEGEGKTTLALGIRDSSVEIKLNLEKDKNKEKLTLEFPK